MRAILWALRVSREECLNYDYRDIHVFPTKASTAGSKQQVHKSYFFHRGSNNRSAVEERERITDSCPVSLWCESDGRFPEGVAQ